MPRPDAVSFLKTLKEDGIEHLYIPKKGHGPRAMDKTRATDQGPRATTELIRGTGNVARGPAEGKRGAWPVVRGSKDAILELRDEVLKCNQCKELVKNRTKVVFGAGNIQAKLVFVGEAPGADEDKQGLPFVGRAGQLLTKIIEAMGLSREQVFICNVLKCRPPNNRPPAPDEVIACRPFLKRQLELIKPRIICALGNHACQALLGTDKGISQLRGSFQEYEGIPVMCTYHPAYLLRSPGEKGKVWEDMKKILQLLQQSHE